MTQKLFKLFVLISCTLPIQIHASSKPFNSLQVAGPAVASSYVGQATRKPLNSLQVAGPLTATGLTSVNGLNVKNGADFGGDVAADGTLFVDGGIVLDSCAVLTCDSGQLLVNGIPVNLGIDCNAIPLTVGVGGALINSPGYYCLTQDVPNLTSPIIINSSDVTLDLNNHTITPTIYTDGIHVSQMYSRITIKNGSIVMSTPGATGINLYGTTNDNDFHIHDVTIDFADLGIQTENVGLANLDIARVIVTNALAAGFSISGASNVTISECQASGDGEGTIGFDITGVSSSSTLLNSCVAANNSGNGFLITGSNVTLTNCVAQGNAGFVGAGEGNAGFALLSGANIMLAHCIANFNNTYPNSYGFYINVSSATLTNCTALGNTNDGFYLDNSANNIVLENCVANFNTGSGFANASRDSGNLFSFISCIAQNNTVSGFDVSASSPSGGSGLIKSCIAEGNGLVPPYGCGFNDASGSTYQYVANVAEGNGTNPGGTNANPDTNYCLDSMGTTTSPVESPFNQSGPNISANTSLFTPTYWNNITLQ